MATIRYRIIGKTDPANIRIRFKQGDQFDYEMITGLKCNLKHWDKDKQKIRNVADAAYKDIVNSKLGHLKLFIEEEYLNDTALGIEISPIWFKDKVHMFFNKPSTEKDSYKYFLDSYIDYFIEESRTKIKMKLGRPVSERTIEYYEITRDKILAYQTNNNLRLKFNDIDIKFHGDFIKFLSTEQQLNLNTIGFYISKLKLFLKSADVAGIKVNSEFKSVDFFVPSSKTQDIYLNEDEIQSIFNLDLGNRQRLANSRDWLVIGVWTGLRVGDLLSLNKENLKNDFIHITSKKTNTPVIIPLHGHVKSILEKNNGEFPRPISDQKFNNYIKEVCKLAKIDKITEGSKMVPKLVGKKEVFRKTFGKYPKHELVSSHICRRSFATNLYGKLDTLTIMKITGHRTEAVFLEYIKITPSEYAKKLEEFWKNKNRI